MRRPASMIVADRWEPQQRTQHAFESHRSCRSEPGNTTDNWIAECVSFAGPTKAAALSRRDLIAAFRETPR